MGDGDLDAELQKHAGRVISHMNDDHTDSILAYALAFASGCSDAESARMSGLNTQGWVLEVTLAGGEVKKGVVVPYTRKVESAGQLHKVAVEMHFAAFHKLGCEPTPPQPLSASHAQLTPAD